jgi:hypothetical protein
MTAGGRSSAACCPSSNHCWNWRAPQTSNFQFGLVNMTPGRECPARPHHLCKPHRASILRSAFHLPLSLAGWLLPVDFEVDFVGLGEDECRSVYGRLSRAHRLPDGAVRVLALTRTA